MLEWAYDTLWWVLGYRKGLPAPQERDMLFPSLYLDASSHIDFRTQRNLYHFRKAIHEERSKVHEVSRAF